MRLADKVAIVTGGVGGIGAAVSRRFAAEGAAVTVADIHDQRGDALVQDIRSSGGDAVYVHLDVTDEKTWERVVEETVSCRGHLDVLVNNAGIYQRLTLESTSSEEWDRMLEVNAKSMFLGAKAAVPAMRAAGGGSIVNVSLYGRSGRESLLPLRRLQGRGAPAVEIDCSAARRGSHPLQLGAPRSGGNRDGIRSVST